MAKVMKFAHIGTECVACGCCVSACPRDAVSIDSGVAACIDDEKCVGCGKCARICPAAVITIIETEA